jgi:4-diphosphocytidyl-2-C-methyl-D-erythritol kinase
VIERAPAKINLTLVLGPTRADGRHALVTVFEPLELHDTVTLEPASGGEDEVVCPGVEGPNLADRALSAFRKATGWDGPPVRLTIEKRIPVAAGMAGGSADAAAALRLAHRASGLGDEALLLALAAELGSDVPAQVRPRRLLGTGAGDVLHELPAPREPLGVLVLPSAHALSTPAVFREADRLGLPRDAEALRRTLDDIRAQPTRPPLERAALEQARAAGAEHALVSGSGPTVVGLFPAPADAERAAAALADREPPPIATRSLV